jgi:hypothetical protein
MSSFYSVNYLEESMSFVERNARKLHPILQEMKKRMIPEKKKGKSIGKGMGKKGKTETLESANELPSEQENEFVI